jgi:hypothetical protein
MSSEEEEEVGSQEEEEERVLVDMACQIDHFGSFEEYVSAC